ncbi:MAG: SdrD B-like domain-containing protein [Acidimicrobiia bacterium]|nr:SdrD B-like domain-containing protein [Acidimicrobiia bacterium]
MTEGNSLRAAGYGVLAFLLVAVSLVTLPPPARAEGNINYSDYTFYFANGTVWEGNTWDEGGGNNATVPANFGVGSARILHVSCSDTFSDGFSDDPAPRFPLASDGTSQEWKILSYHIDKYQSKNDVVPGDMTKIQDSCGETFVPASITVVKDTLPLTSDPFSFELDAVIASPPSAPSFVSPSLPDDRSVSGAGGSYTWGNLLAGSYTLSELIGSNPPEYEFASVECTNGASSAGVPSVAFGLHGGEHVTCTFVNQAEITLIPNVDIEKATNGEDADTATGPEIPIGDPVTWTYVVTNTGELPLTGVTVIDNQGVAVWCPRGTLGVGESMTCTASGTAVEGQYANLGTVTTTEGPSDEDPSHYFGLTPAVDIEKATNGFDADDPQGPWLVAGNDVTWTYVVTNTGELPLTGVTVTDDVLGAICEIGELAIGASDTCTAAGIATIGQYANLGTVTTDEGVSDEDPSHYYGFIPEEPGIDIEKATNGEDADDPTGPSILAGDPVTWTYLVSNTGNIQLTGVEVLDDQGVAVSCPTDSLDVGESMECTATGTATVGQYSNLGTVTTDQEVSDEDPSHYIGYAVGSIGDFVWFDQNKNGIQDGGEPGVAGIDVYLHEGEVCSGEPIAQTTTDADGLYLFDGLFAGTYCIEFQLPYEYAFSPADQGGDGALDSDAPTEVVVLAEGEDNLSVDAGLVGGDITLEKETDVATEETFGFDFNGTQEVDLGSGGSATFHVPGGVYSITEFVAQGWELVEVQCGDIEADIDLTGGNVTLFVPPGGSVGCTFLNHEIQEPVGLIGDFVWKDTDGDGVQDEGEPGIAGVKVELFDAETDESAGSTNTDADGIYVFGNVAAGDYYLLFTGPVDWEFTLADEGSDDAADSDADALDPEANPQIGRTAVFALGAGVADLSRDAGLIFVEVFPQVITTTTTTTAPPTTTTTTVPPATTTTTVADTTVETLPFTGFGEGGMGSLGFALIVLGGLVLMAVSRKETDLEVVSEEAPARSWED